MTSWFKILKETAGTRQAIKEGDFHVIG